jgi:hypothetical protein
VQNAEGRWFRQYKYCEEITDVVKQTFPDLA